MERKLHFAAKSRALPELTDEDLGINEEEYAETVASFDTEMSIRGVIETVVARERLEDSSSPPMGHGDGLHSSDDSDDHHDGDNQPPKRKRKRYASGGRHTS